MKICELKVQAYTDRTAVIQALVHSGYRVSLREKKKDNCWGTDEYFVVVEAVENGKKKED